MAEKPDLCRGPQEWASGWSQQSVAARRRALGVPSKAETELDAWRSPASPAWSREAVGKPCDMLAPAASTLTFGLEVCLAAGITYVPPLLLEVGVEEKFMTMVLGESPRSSAPPAQEDRPPGEGRHQCLYPAGACCP